MKKPSRFPINITVNGNKITTLLIGRHYLEKHSSYMNDEIIIQLVTALDGRTFPVDSITDGIEYYFADIELLDTKKVFRLIWLFEGEQMEILGVINAYRRKKINEQKKK